MRWRHTSDVVEFDDVITAGLEKFLVRTLGSHSDIIQTIADWPSSTLIKEWNCKIRNPSEVDVFEQNNQYIFKLHTDTSFCVWFAIAKQSDAVSMYKTYKWTLLKNIQLVYCNTMLMRGCPLINWKKFSCSSNRCYLNWILNLCILLSSWSSYPLFSISMKAKVSGMYARCWRVYRDDLSCSSHLITPIGQTPPTCISFCYSHPWSFLSDSEVRCHHSRVALAHLKFTKFLPILTIKSALLDIHT